MYCDDEDRPLVASTTKVSVKLSGRKSFARGMLRAFGDGYASLEVPFAMLPMHTFEVQWRHFFTHGLSASGVRQTFTGCNCKVLCPKRYMTG